MREFAAGYRISAAALDPLLELVEARLHSTFVLSRSMSFEVNGKRSINLRSFNLAEAALLRPHLFRAGPPLSSASFDDDVNGIRSDMTAFEPKAKKAKKAKEDGGDDDAVVSEDEEGAASDEEDGVVSEDEEDASEDE